MIILCLYLWWRTKTLIRYKLIICLQINSRLIIDFLIWIHNFLGAISKQVHQNLYSKYLELQIYAYDTEQWLLEYLNVRSLTADLEVCSLQVEHWYIIHSCSYTRHIIFLETAHIRSHWYLSFNVKKKSHFHSTSVWFPPDMTPHTKFEILSLNRASFCQCYVQNL